MSSLVLGPPTVAGFLQFIRGNMGINSTVLPDNAPVIDVAFGIALDIANDQLNVKPNVYTLAVYNLAVDNLVNYAPDVQPPVIYKDDLPYFAYLRQEMNITGFVSGVIQSASDESTSSSLVVPEQLKMLTLANLQNTKTPWGRTYLGFAQAAGTLWGLS